MLELYVHRRHTFVEDLRPDELDAGHDLLLVGHECHPKPLDVPAGHTATQEVIYYHLRDVFSSEIQVNVQIYSINIQHP